MFQTNTAGKINVVKQNASSDMKVAILGISRIVRLIFENPEKSKLPDPNLVGFINVDPIDNTIDLSGLPRLLGGFKDIKSIIRKYGIKKILVAMDLKDDQKLTEVIRYCENENVEYEFLNNTSANLNASNNNIGRNRSFYQTTYTATNSDAKTSNGGLTLGIHNTNPVTEKKLSFKYLVGELIKKDPPPREFVLQRILSKDCIDEERCIFQFVPGSRHLIEQLCTERSFQADLKIPQALCVLHFRCNGR